MTGVQTCALPICLPECTQAPHGTVPAEHAEHHHAGALHCPWIGCTAPGVLLRILDPRSGQNLVVTHLHGLRDATGKHDTPARHAQAEALVSQIERIWRQGEPLVVCGDLNLLPDSATFSVLGRLGLRDLVTGGGHTDTRTSHYAKEGRFADYMLATPEVEIRSFEVVREPEVSDHRALLLETR